jgi:serine/threonine protein phosphatase PrpC
MTQSKNDKIAKGGKSASSLNDAVFAALAQVEERAKSEPPTEVGSKGSAKASAAPAAPVAATEPPSGVARPAAEAPPPDDASAPSPRNSVIPLATRVVEGSEPPPAPSAAESSAAESSAAESSAAESSAAESSAGESSAGESSAAGSSAGESSAAGSSAAESSAAESSAAESSATDSAVTAAPRASAASRGPAPDGLTARYFGRTDVGLVREHNEDNFLVVDLAAKRRGVEDATIDARLGKNGCVFAVCDGMGGAAAGEVASQMAVDTIFEVMDEGGTPRDRDEFARRLVRAVEEAGSRIFAAAKMDRTRRGMGTTATVAGLVDATLFVGQVGDSRAYVLRGDRIALITKDQSLVNQLIEAGQLTEEEAEAFEHSNIILQALGTTEEVTVDLTFLELRRGDRLLLCSDGLSGLVHAEMMKEVLSGAERLPDAAERLIAMANAGGGHDNITVVLVEFDGTALKEPDAEARAAYQQYPLPPAPADEPKVPSRAPQMKAGGAKPGADVKKANPSIAPRPVSAVGDDPENGGSPLVWLGATVLIILILAAIAWAISGSGSSPPEAPVGVRDLGTLPTEASPPPSSGSLAAAVDPGSPTTG